MEVQALLKNMNTQTKPILQLIETRGPPKPEILKLLAKMTKQSTKGSTKGSNYENLAGKSILY